MARAPHKPSLLQSAEFIEPMQCHLRDIIEG
jgi:hypothetical protein